MRHCEFLSWCASMLMLCTYFSRGACRSRALAVATNIAFILYASSVDARFVLTAHLLLLPVNGLRLVAALRDHYARPSLHPTTAEKPL